jgi:hypothetical protein
VTATDSPSVDDLAAEFLVTAAKARRYLAARRADLPTPAPSSPRWPIPPDHDDEEPRSTGRSVDRVFT